MVNNVNLAVVIDFVNISVVEAIVVKLENVLLIRAEVTVFNDSMLLGYKVVEIL